MARSKTFPDMFARIRRALPRAKRVLAHGLDSNIGEVYEIQRLRSVDLSNEQLTDVVHNYDRMYELGIAVGLLLNRDLLAREPAAAQKRRTTDRA